MKKQACKKLADALLPYLPEYIYENRAKAVFHIPVGNIFQGIIFDSSGFSADVFYPEIIVQPLYVRAEGFRLTFGTRLPNNWVYKTGQEETLAERMLESMEREGAFRLIDDLSTPEKFVRNLSKYHSNPADPYFQQATAYSLAMCGDFDVAVSWLDKCRTTLQEMQKEQPDIRWYAPFLNEVTKFRDVVATDQDAAMKQLEEWTEYTRTKLRLPF